MWARGMWSWWVALLPKGVSGQFISLPCMCVSANVRETLCVPSPWQLSNSMAEAQLYHYSNMESLWLCMVCLQSIHKLTRTDQLLFFFFSVPHQKNLDGCLDLLLFFVLPRLKQWPNFDPAPGSYKKKRKFRVSDACAEGNRCST